MNRYEVASSISGETYVIDAVLALSAKAQAARLDGAWRASGCNQGVVEQYTARLLEAPKE